MTGTKMSRTPHPRTRLGSLLLATILVSACGDGGTGPDGVEVITLPRALTLSESVLVDASAAFAFDLLGRLVEAEPGTNIFVSPLSASMALGMTMNGTAGSTLSGMRTAMGFGDMPLDEINASYESLITLLSELDDRVTFELANAIFYREGFEVEDDFIRVTREHFGASVEALDFSSPSAPDRINDWVSDRTAGRITEMVEPPIDPLTMMFLLNAIYFQGTWTWEFDPERTHEGSFRAGDGGTAPARFMEQVVTVPYVENQDLQAVDLPYGGQAFSMTILLPRDGGELLDLVAQLDPTSWDAMLSAMEPEDGTVRMPRFRLEYDALLNDPLSAMGMADAFSPDRADFTPMYEGARDAGLHIKGVKQKTFVEVDEEGTEAAAVTSVEVGVTCACPTGFFLDANRPFLFAIRERLTGTLLFAGVLHHPPPA
jgi:serpin B